MLGGAEAALPQGVKAYTRNWASEIAQLSKFDKLALRGAWPAFWAHVVLLISLIDSSGFDRER